MHPPPFALPLHAGDAAPTRERARRACSGCPDSFGSSAAGPVFFLSSRAGEQETGIADARGEQQVEPCAAQRWKWVRRTSTATRRWRLAPLRRLPNFRDGQCTCDRADGDLTVTDVAANATDGSRPTVGVTVHGVLPSGACSRCPSPIPPILMRGRASRSRRRTRELPVPDGTAGYVIPSRGGLVPWLDRSSGWSDRASVPWLDGWSR